jgi:hypothetical protein
MNMKTYLKINFIVLCFALQSCNTRPTAFELPIPPETAPVSVEVTSQSKYIFNAVAVMDSSFGWRIVPIYNQHPLLSEGYIGRGFFFEGEKLEEFKVQGLKVKFSGKEIPPAPNVRMAGAVIEIIRIKIEK